MVLSKIRFYKIKISLFEFGMGASGDKKTVDPNGKAAMERVGLFAEVGYISIGMNTGATWRLFD